MNMLLNEEDSKLQNTERGTPMGSLSPPIKSLKTICDNHQGNSLKSLKRLSMSNIGLNFCNFPGCNLNFRSNYDLKRHAKRHLNFGNYQCKICDHLFQRYDELKRHLYTHSDKKPFKCSLCDFCCIQSYDLVKHKYSHTHEKPHICQICNKAFTRAARLKEHYRVHTGEQPYSCKICNQTFSNRRNLNDHSTEHIKSNQESLDATIPEFSWQKEFRPFKCNTCFKEYTSLLSFKRHMNHHLKKIHTCTICQKSFSYMCDLTSHRLTHSNKNSCICSICPEIVSPMLCKDTDLNFDTGSSEFKSTSNAFPLCYNIFDRIHEDRIQLNDGILDLEDRNFSSSESSNDRSSQISYTNCLKLNNHNLLNNITKDSTTGSRLPYSISISKMDDKPQIFDKIKMDDLPSNCHDDNLHFYENLNYQNISSFSFLEDQFLSTEKYSH